MAYPHSPNRASAEGTYFGVPLGDLGWIQSVMMGVAAGLMAFCASTFVSIMALLVYSVAAHHPVDFAISYKRIGFPIGVTVLVVALSFFGYLWVRRILRGRPR